MGADVNDDVTMLQFNWESVEGRPVKAILGQNLRLMDGILAAEAIALVVEDYAVMMTVNPETDELLVCLTPTPEAVGWASVDELKDKVGKDLGWCWVGCNYKGYFDSFTLAFNGVEPNCMFVGAASAIWIKSVVNA